MRVKSNFSKLSDVNESQRNDLFHDAKRIVLLEHNRSATTARIVELEMAIEQHTDGRIVGNGNLDGHDTSAARDLFRFKGTDLRPGWFRVGQRSAQRTGRVELELHFVRLSARGGAGAYGFDHFVDAILASLRVVDDRASASSS